jgi:hypothetical protein
MYVAQNEITTSVGANQVSVFKAPVQTGSTMSSMISTPTATSGVWTDSSGRVYVESRTAIAIYSALNEGNALQATFPNGANGSSSTPVCCNIALGPTGSLYVPTQTGPGRIYVFDPPFTNTSAPDIAETIQLPDDPSTPYLFDAAFDAAGNLYVGSGLVFFEGATAVSHVYMLKPPYLAVSADVVLYGDQIQGVAIGP